MIAYNQIGRLRFLSFMVEGEEKGIKFMTVK